MAQRTSLERYTVKRGADATLVSAWTHSRQARAAARTLNAKDGQGYFVYDEVARKVLVDLLPTKLVCVRVCPYDSEWKADEFADTLRASGVYARVRISKGADRWTVRAYKRNLNHSD